MKHLAWFALVLIASCSSKDKQDARDLGVPCDVIAGLNSEACGNEGSKQGPGPSGNGPNGPSSKPTNPPEKPGDPRNPFVGTWDVNGTYNFNFTGTTSVPLIIGPENDQIAASAEDPDQIVFYLTARALGPEASQCNIPLIVSGNQARIVKGFECRISLPTGETYQVTYNSGTANLCCRRSRSRTT